jgi:hypothetical protein
MKKTFVSLSFTSTKLQVLQLTSNKKKVVKFGSVDIPQGLVAGSRVTDTAKMSQLIKMACKEKGINEKLAGIVVPEFSTYTRTLNLPYLPYKELDEAVSWKMKEFLPNAGSGMVMDWQILSKTDKMCEVLVVSISEMVLASYVSSVEFAGLLPLVVETPSLSLARLGFVLGETKMIIYAQGGEVLILFIKGKEILGSTVSVSSDPEGIAKLAYQMSRHYVESPAQKLLLGGMDITQHTLQLLQEKLKLPIEWFKMDILGLSAAQVQEYLIALSLQNKDPAAPADENTINLLPRHWAKKYKDKHNKDQIWFLAVISAFVIVICLMASLGANLIIQDQINKLRNEKLSQNSPTELIDQVSKVNKVADNVIKVIAASKNPTEVINSISAAKPAGIVLNTYNLNLEEGYVALSGISADRKSLLEFKNKLGENADFGPIDVPLSSLEQDANINFDFRFDYLPAKKAKPAPPVKLKT